MDEFDWEARRRQQEEILQQLEAAKTDPQELAEILDEYDFDDAMVAEFNRITQTFHALKQEFLAVQKTTQLRLNSHA